MWDQTAIFNRRSNPQWRVRWGRKGEIQSPIYRHPHPTSDRELRPRSKKNKQGRSTARETKTLKQKTG